MEETSEILILGAADLSDAYMFLNGGVAPHKIHVTELRTFKELVRDYGEKFTDNFYDLQRRGIRTTLGFNALNLQTADLYGIKFIYWGCPHFGNASKSRSLHNFFTILCKHLHDPQQQPLVGIGLDCGSADGDYNLATRFKIFDIEKWQVKCMTDLPEYQFTPTKKKKRGREVLTDEISESAKMFLLTPRKKQNIPSNHNYIYISTKIDTSAKETPNLFKIPLISFNHFLSCLCRTEHLNHLHRMQFISSFTVRYCSSAEKCTDFWSIHEKNIAQKSCLFLYVPQEYRWYAITNINNSIVKTHIHHGPLTELLRKQTAQSKDKIFKIDGSNDTMLRQCLLDDDMPFIPGVAPFPHRALDKVEVSKKNCFSNPKKPHPIRDAKIHRATKDKDIDGDPVAETWLKTRGGLLPKRAPYSLSQSQSPPDSQNIDSVSMDIEDDSHEDSSSHCLE